MSMILRTLSACAALALIATPAMTAAAAARKKAPAKAAPLKPSALAIALPLKLLIPERQRLCDTATATGLRYKQLRPGAGVMPTDADRVQVHYIGYLAKDGEVFDQGRDVTFAVTRVIPGFSDGLKLMTPGSIYRLCVPHTLGYGEDGSGPIPPAADLVFQVELVTVNPAKAK
ncbi:FKBP-type peptidyl-prolyl cis-trans isomerase [Novosphingobium sp.]|uniref:FKBP-type peptidyl-prolyl cis-trans isomerase n=1 Tax=Novosphingobium sp. TaxID=1874826 RepID=UPI002734F1FB|nr:FKBP-type peptidyl-prolyl cis-trans isomerase [Novosphingobium sp.]MDP3907251.1 FKBP-type peptidyl-prolyl cis-trans isomerase [Novosphingobium sp.]